MQPWPRLLANLLPVHHFPQSWQRRAMPTRSCGRRVCRDGVLASILGDEDNLDREGMLGCDNDDDHHHHLPPTSSSKGDVRTPPWPVRDPPSQNDGGISEERAVVMRTARSISPENYYFAAAVRGSWRGGG